MTNNILVTGGLGFIGSHTCIELLKGHNNIIIVDNLFNSKISIKDTIEKISNKSIIFYKVDLLNIIDLEKVFQKHKFDLIIHFAGMKAVNESIKKPLLYYKNNVQGTLNLLDLSSKYNIKNIIFSSSATVYGTNVYPVDENAIVGQGITNPYGQTKYIIENILHDLVKSNNSLSIICLRYFNPVGAHPSGSIGENPNDIPNNLFPHILKQKLTIFGNNYNTRDGTCIRDFIHVVDLAKGHVLSMSKMNKPGFYVYNLGTGKGTSVLEFINTFEKVNNTKIDYTFGNRRDGDLEIVYANVNKAYKELNWKTELTIEDVCKDGSNFIQCSKK